MRVLHFATTVLATALLFAGARVAAKTVTCPPAAASGTIGSDEPNWSAPFSGPLVAVRLTTPTAGDQKGEATVSCVRASGSISMPGGRCRITPGVGGRITTTTDTAAEIVTCTPLGADVATNDRSCFVVCD